MTTISGSVLDASGNPAARTVRAYRRDTGALLGQASSAAADAVDGDDNFASVSILLHGDGANGSTTFIDSGPNALTPSSVTGNVQISTTDPKFGTGAILFDGSGDAINYGASAAFAFGTGAYTIEFWMKSTAATGTPLSQPVNTNGWGFIFLSGTLYIQLAYNSTNDITVAGAGFLNGSWNHVALCRSGTSVRLFLNGVQQGSTVTNSRDYTSQTIKVGSGPSDFNGRIDDLRITKGVARYTANFTPPAASFQNSGDIPANALGDYSIDCGSYTGEVQVICLDDEGGTLENDLIHRTFPV